MTHHVHNTAGAEKKTCFPGEATIQDGMNLSFRIGVYLALRIGKD
jgi:hypothetical protein